MIQHLLPSFQSKFWTAEHDHLIKLTMGEENTRIMDPAHLESQVIGKGEFDWDFRCLETGFWDIVSPFMQQPSGSPHLLLLAMDELGVASTKQRALIPLVEFPHYITRVNDYYNQHPSLNQPKPKRRIAARLTQLKYAAQFLGVYPRYLVLNNHMEADLPTRNRLHAIMFQFAVLYGTSRGLMMEWNRHGLTGVSENTYFQTSVHTLSGYLMGPVSLACVMAGVPQDETQKVKKAFSWLSIAAKLELERRVINDMITEPLSRETRPEFLINSFPGAYEILSPQTKQKKYQQFPDIVSWHQDIITAQRDQGISCHPRLNECLDHFQEEMANTGLMPD